MAYDGPDVVAGLALKVGYVAHFFSLQDFVIFLFLMVDGKERSSFGVRFRWR